MLRPIDAVIALDGRTLTPAAGGRDRARRAEARDRARRARAQRGGRAAGAPAARSRRADVRRHDRRRRAALRAVGALEDSGDFQWRLLRSHAGGGGAPLTVEVVRAAMAVRANQLGAGGAGVGEQPARRAAGRAARGVTPFARELGSLGTGDLTVLAEIGAGARRRGRVLGGRRRRARRRGAGRARARAGPLRPARRHRAS